MAAITASLVKELREKSGAGMMDCKKALTETNGDFEAAVTWLREKGMRTVIGPFTEVGSSITNEPKVAQDFTTLAPGFHS